MPRWHTLIVGLIYANSLGVSPRIWLVAARTRTVRDDHLPRQAAGQGPRSRRLLVSNPGVLGLADVGHEDALVAGAPIGKHRLQAMAEPPV